MGNIAGTEPRSTSLTERFRVNFADLFIDVVTGWPRNGWPKAVKREEVNNNKIENIEE